jgi:2-(1,2-epoxy-1,2-dihydrophenyl)acetyl-CoA isomerase
MEDLRVPAAVTSADGVASLELDRPDALNAMDPGLLERLSERLDEAVRDGARAAVLAGEGRAFCAGADLALVRSALQGDPTPLATLVDTLHPLIRRLREAPFPIVAALEGPVVGAGMGLALAADLRVAARSATLVPGYMRIGTSPDGGVSAFLTRALGGPRTLSLLLRNRRLGAEDMLALGLAEEVVDDGEAVAAAHALAASVANTSSAALLQTRSLIDSATTLSLSDQLDRERELVSRMWGADDFREGVSAFLEKRSPRFGAR